MLEPKSLQKVAGISAAGSGIHNSDKRCQIDTKCRFATGGNRTLSEDGGVVGEASDGWPTALALGRVDGGGVHQHDRDIVLNGVNAAADTAFQTLPVRVQDDRLFTDRADQHIQQILGDHRNIIVMLGEGRLHGVILHVVFHDAILWCSRNSRATSLPQGTQGTQRNAIESPFYLLHSIHYTAAAR